MPADERPDPPLAGPDAAVAETHISIVFFVGDRAYKLKKPVRFPFADFRTREAREQACHREVELNRRLAPDVYLGVSDIHGVDGLPADHLVVMRRMPADRRLAHLVRTCATPADRAELGQVLDQVAAQVAAFHAKAHRSPTIDRAATADAVRARWAENFDELRPFAATIDPDQLARAEALTDEILTGRSALFAARIAEGQICDGHGDLQADDVFALPDGPRILDCIEFDDELRFVDVVDDVAFLAMDLERLGAPDLARAFLRSYATAAGVELPHTLLELSTAYRAQVRAKIACLRAAQHDVGSPDHQDAAASARLLLGICVRHLEAGRVRLVVVGGLPGTGKSTLAAALGAELDATVLRSDVTRKARAGLAPDDHADAPYRSGLYASDTTDAVYRDLLEQARPLLRAGRSVVLDASFADERHRARARSLAATTSSAITELRCVLPDESAAVRMQARRAEGHDASDATPEIAQAMAGAFDPWPQAVPVPTSGPPAAAAHLALAEIAQARPAGPVRPRS